jgi:SAM-dependent methyltransferase
MNRFAFDQNDQKKLASNSDGLMAGIKYFFKKYPKFYYYLAYIFGGRQVNITAQKFVARLPLRKVIINVGSGTKILRSDVINIDFTPFEGVKIVAPAERLPLETGSVDVAVCDNLLEHIKNPVLVVAEIKRVLKKDGLVYVGVPFIINYHSSPDDFQRWTSEGLLELMKDFEKQELKIACGPTSAMATILSEWLALLCSFNIKFLYNFFLIIFTILLTPLKWLDYLLSHYNYAENIAYGFYFIGKKK